MTSAESIPALSSDRVKAAINEFAVGFNHSYYQPLCLAILKGDWKSTRDFLDNDPSALTAKVSVLGRTALHVAAAGAQWRIVMNLVQEMPKDVLTELDLMGRTCLHYVAMSEGEYDAKAAAKALVAKNPCVTQVTDFKGFTPLIYSITTTGSKEMLWYLYMNTTDERPGCPFSGPSASQLVALLTTVGYHDITLHLLQRYPNLATISDSNGSIILNILSKLPKHFLSGHNLGFWKSCIYHCVHVEFEDSPSKSSRGNTLWTAPLMLTIVLAAMTKVGDIKLRHVSAVRLVELIFSRASTMNDYKFLQSFVSPEIIFNATSSGIVEILKTCFQFFPDLVWTHIPNEGYVVQIAIRNRQERVFRLLSKMPIICKLLVLELDESQNTTSHLAARFSSQIESISGAAFQMQRELHWFKVVEKLDDPLHKEVKNNGGKTAWQLFKEQHKTLLDEAKVWIKDRSNSGMVVATLIATITFAAAITVPGGIINQEDKGKPILLSDKTFTVFVVSDALAFFCSMASLLMFLSAINGRYTEEDFMQILPIRLVLGSNFLLFAVVAATLAFNAALSMLVEKQKVFIITFSSLAFIPFILMARFQFPELKGIEGNKVPINYRNFWQVSKFNKLYKKITSR